MSRIVILLKALFSVLRALVDLLPPGTRLDMAAEYDGTDIPLFLPFIPFFGVFLFFSSCLAPWLSPDDVFWELEFFSSEYFYLLYGSSFATAVISILFDHYAARYYEMRAHYESFFELSIPDAETLDRLLVEAYGETA